jgi:hypothetical protein
MIYRVPLGPHGSLPASHTPRFRCPATSSRPRASTTPTASRRRPTGKALLIVQSNAGQPHRVDVRTGATTAVDLRGEVPTNGDGLLVEGRTLYVVQNRPNAIMVFSLARGGSSGGVLRWTGLPVQRPLRRTVHARDDVQHRFGAGAGQSEGSVSRSSHRPPVRGITRLGNLIVASRK